MSNLVLPEIIYLIYLKKQEKKLKVVNLGGQIGGGVRMTPPTRKAHIVDIL